MFSLFRSSVMAFFCAVCAWPAAMAQPTAASLQTELATAWQVVISGDARLRTLTIKKVTAGADNKFQVEGTYGFATAGQGAIKDGELALSGNEKKLSFVTGADSRIAATQGADGSFAGNFFNAKGKPTPVTITKLEQVAAAVANAAAVAANRVMLTKPEMEATVSGKRWTFVRRSDGQTVLLDLRSDGQLYANNQTTGQTDSGRWSMTDSGQLCLKFRGGSNDVCMALANENGALKMINVANPGVVGSDLNKVE